jgi:hypothetical protein
VVTSYESLASALSIVSTQSCLSPSDGTCKINVFLPIRANVLLRFTATRESLFASGMSVYPCRKSIDPFKPLCCCASLSLRKYLSTSDESKTHHRCFQFFRTCPCFVIQPWRITVGDEAAIATRRKCRRR